MRKRKKKNFSLFLAICLILSITFTSYAAQDDFPEGMTEAEKQQMLKEMYEDINSNQEVSITEPTVDFSTMPDEEIEKVIKERIPDEKELTTIMGSLEDQVFPLATYKGSYDRASKLYKYTFSKGGSVLLSVPLGAVTNYAVAVDARDGAQILEISRDGQSVNIEVNDNGGYFFREAGTYAFLASSSHAGKGFISGTFRIVSKETPIRDSHIWSPEGYFLSEVKHGNSLEKVVDGRYYSFLEDGYYELIYRPKSDLNGTLPEYNVALIRDTTAPIIDWEGEIVNGRFAGAVTYSYKEKDAIIDILYNGQKAVSENHVLAASGNYYITATDSVGNSRTYSFTIIRKGEIPWKWVLIVFAGLLIIGLLIVYFSRFDMKVQQKFLK